MDAIKRTIWPFKGRLRACGIHLCISLVVAALIAWLVFSLWYPYPYREISGGRELFILVMAVDVVMGPLITLIIFNQTKPRREIILDLIVVGVLQFSALGYGLWTVYAARPIHMVFEYHRLAIVHASDVDPALLEQAPENLQKFPLTGPTMLSLRPFKGEKEQYESTMMALSGVPQAVQPALWQPWHAAQNEILKEAHPAADLKKRFEAQSEKIDQAVALSGHRIEDLLYLPLLAKKGNWTALIDAHTTIPVAFFSLDSF